MITKTIDKLCTRRSIKNKTSLNIYWTICVGSLEFSEFMEPVNKNRKNSIDNIVNFVFIKLKKSSQHKKVINFDLNVPLKMNNTTLTENKKLCQLVCDPTQAVDYTQGRDLHKDPTKCVNNSCGHL